MLRSVDVLGPGQVECRIERLVVRRGVASVASRDGCWTMSTDSIGARQADKRSGNRGCASVGRRSWQELALLGIDPRAAVASQGGVRLGPNQCGSRSRRAWRVHQCTAMSWGWQSPADKRFLHALVDLMPRARWAESRRSGVNHFRVSVVTGSAAHAAALSNTVMMTMRRNRSITSLFQAVELSIQM